MPRQSTVYEVLIASPSDVGRERTVLAEVLEDWNSANSRTRNTSLQALRWELDGVPSSGDCPQQILNKQLVEKADILMAVFWMRLGTPTGAAPSGTAEEIEYFRKLGKPVFLYFSEADIPHHHDPNQLRLLKEYRNKLTADNFVPPSFRDVEELRRRAARDLAHVMNELLSSAAQLRQTTSYPILDFDFTPEAITPTTQSEYIPKLSLQITNRGDFAIKEVQMQATEYTLQRRAAIVAGAKIGRAARVARQIGPKGGKSRLRSIHDLMPVFRLENVGIQEHGVARPMPANENFYALRFSFIDAGSQKRYCFYKVIMARPTYLLADESPFGHAWATSDPRAAVPRLNGWIQAPRNLILNDQRKMYANSPEEEYIPGGKKETAAHPATA